MGGASAFGQQSAFGGAGQQTRSLFGGAQSAFGQPQQTQGPAGAGLFGQASQPPLSSQASFGGQSGFGGGFGGGTLGQQNPAIGQGAIYARQNEYQPQVSTVSDAFQPTIENQQDPKVKEPQSVLHIQSMRGKPQYRHLSNEMLRVLDLGASKG